MNPYEVLGLSANEASDKEVIAAHRKLRSAAHPDHGGSQEQMTAINQARDILLNPDRKRRFDNLGSTEQGPPSIEEQAMMIIGNLFQSAIASANEFYTNDVEIFAQVAAEIAQGLNKALEAQSAHPRHLARARRLSKRVKCAPALRKMLDARVGKIETEIREINQQVELGRYMLKLMQSVEFK